MNRFGGQPQPQRQQRRFGNARNQNGPYQGQQNRPANQNQHFVKNEPQTPVQNKQNAVKPDPTPVKAEQKPNVNQNPTQQQQQAQQNQNKQTPQPQQTPNKQNNVQQTPVKPNNPPQTPQKLMQNNISPPQGIQHHNNSLKQDNNMNQQNKPNNLPNKPQNANFGGGNNQAANGPANLNQINQLVPKQGVPQGGPGNKRQSMNDFGGAQNNRQQNQRGPRPLDNKGAPREEHILASKLKELQGPLLDLPPLDQTEVRFSGRSRLYIGNLPPDMTEKEVEDLFKPYGQTAELFINKEKNFGFIRIDYRANAEKARHELDGANKYGRQLKIRFAPHNSAIKVKNLTPFVSNELLYKSFEIFGKIERAFVKVDERGKSLCEGIVEFSRKPNAQAAIRHCSEKCFFLTSSLKPVIVESLDEPDEADGYQEKALPKRHQEFMRARELGPRFAEPGSFEHEYGTRWKQLHELYKQKEDALKLEKGKEEDKLEAQMEFAKYEHETELLREQLRQREQDRERQKRSFEMAERAAEERREVERQALMRQEEEMTQRMRRQDDELRRRQQENTLFVQAQRLNSMLDMQEQNYEQPMDRGYSMNGPPNNWNDMNRGGYDDQMGQQGRWEQHQDFPNKRRRF